MTGYIGRILRVNLTTGSISIEEVPDQIFRKFIGGSGLAAWYLLQETEPNADPLAPDNRLIFMAGPLTGTTVPCSGRHAVAAKSPLTGIWGEANCGGAWGSELKRAGYDGIVVQGQAESPVYLWIEDGQAELRPADELWGLDTYQTSEYLQGQLGPRVRVSCIGPAGERLVRLAAVMSDGRDGRAAARSGLGAVMGSKRLKAIAVRGSRRVELARPEKVRELNRELAPRVRESPSAAILGTHGTGGSIAGLEASGHLPIKNWRLGSWPAGAARLAKIEAITGARVKSYSCRGCIIGCGREVKFAGDRYGPVDGAAPEYESVACLGSNCLVDDPEAVCLANELCNRYGIDTMSTGSAIAFAFEAYERGLLGEADAGHPLRWGDPDALLTLVRLIGERRGLGELLGQGVQVAAQELGGLAPEFALHVKGLELPAHDPRSTASLALAYATSNRGACHLQGQSSIYEGFASDPDLGYPEPLEPFASEGKVELVIKSQHLAAMYDSLSLCKYLAFTDLYAGDLVRYTNAVTGWNMDLQSFLEAGERLFNLKRLYNVRCGISRKDDTLPPRTSTLSLQDGGTSGYLPRLGEMLGRYYDLRGWDEMGIPTTDKLAALGLEES